jgi:hypothetical protein
MPESTEPKTIIVHTITKDTIQTHLTIVFYFQEIQWGKKGGKEKEGKVEAAVLLKFHHTHLHIQVCSLWSTQNTCPNLFPEPQHGRWQPTTW